MSVLSHLSLNYKLLLFYLKSETPELVLGFLTVLLVVAYGVALNKQISRKLALQMDEAAFEAESR